ncbi:hypothetical protein [Candidatus Neptunochlamydia vexilliferae]|uniref:Pex N-terminal domain-containing protein n=1 Tax=Candidatus Neptunichlamydia vexilliferae TaxID=1651774 RepID=A0ABS0AY38_9BACT|nr:hypothetical protein [Candidatus Neptunochlamydia vexilliferae]MBF5058884.1 hypothetical protein [Candidatus Neptunochlamydia vexilliferae]
MLIKAPLPLSVSSDLFHQTYLSSSHSPNETRKRGRSSLFTFIDELISLMRLPYLFLEVRRVYHNFKKKRTFELSSEDCYQILSIIANSAEILLWLCEKRWIKIGKKGGSWVQGICYISRMILYEQALYQEGRIFFAYRRAIKLDPKVGEERQYKQLKMELISHSAYLAWVTLHFISHVSSISYPQTYLKFLHTTSFCFGLISRGYKERGFGPSTEIY